ncbi:MAG: sensor histidine kinase [Fibrobacteres bacterium]|nr:sensor histidine kinase [Fibrobacterota bacterium]
MQSEILASINRDASPKTITAFEDIISAASSVSEVLEALDEAQGKCNSIIISDTGSGMSIADLQKNFLVIGTASRKHEVEKALAKGAKSTPFLGEKGIGRLSAMRLGNKLRVETARVEDTKFNVLEIDWDLFENLDAMIDEIVINPKSGALKTQPSWSGTRIIITKLEEDWTRRKVEKTADEDFSKLTDPFLDPKKQKRIALFWNEDRVMIPTMNKDLLENAHAIVKGEYSIENGKPNLTCSLEAINLGFDHPKKLQVSTVSADDIYGAVIGKELLVPESALVTVGPFRFEAYWYNRKNLSRIDGIGEQRAVRDLQIKWSGIRLFRDAFRVFPYGDDEDDWLDLDRKALGRSGYALNKAQFVGRVEISRTANKNLLDQTNREGLRETPEQIVFVRIMKLIIQDQLLNFMRQVEQDFKKVKKTEFSESKSEIKNLEARTNIALKKLKKLAISEGQDLIEELQQAVFEFSDLAARAQTRILEAEQESRQMVEMAGVGLMVEVVAHELARASENALKMLDGLKRKSIPDELRGYLETLREEMKSLGKRIRILDPMSISGRQRFEVFSLSELIKDTIQAHEAQFKRHNIHVVLDLPTKADSIKAVKGMVVQILENLISNSIYWLDIKASKSSKLIPEIKISLQENPSTILFEDNGQGIAIENQSKVFEAWFSLKEPSKRRGLGLFIAKESAEYNKGKLYLDQTVNPDTGRLHRFVLEIPNSK